MSSQQAHVGAALALVQLCQHLPHRGGSHAAVAADGGGDTLAHHVLHGAVSQDAVDGFAQIDVHMGVNIHETGGHIPAGCIDDPLSLILQSLCTDTDDGVAADGHAAFKGRSAAAIDDLGIGDK